MALRRIPTSLRGIRSAARIGRIGVPMAVALVGSLLGACHDVAAPQLGVIVSLASPAQPALSADSAGRQLIACELSLVAKDHSGRRAGWLAATFAFYLAGDSTRALAVDTVPAATIRASWGADSIGPDSVRTARWRVSAGIPFALRIVFNFQLAGGPPDSSALRVSCAPPLSPGPPPIIAALQGRPDSLLEPGDTLHVEYTASSGVGLWESVVHLTGPCDTTAMFPEQLQPAVFRSVALVLPAGCSLGVGMTVTVAVFDASSHGTARSITLPGLVDRRAPVLSAVALTPYVAWSSAPLASFSGFVFAGDGVDLSVTAADNHALHAVYWEIQPAGYRDSVVVSGPTAAPSVTITTRAGWTVAQQLRLYATDASGNVSDTIATAPGAVQVVPTVGPVPAVTYVPGDITDVTFDAKRGVIYLLQSNSYKIAVFSPATLSVARTIAMTDYASAIDLSPGGDSLITVLMNSHALGVVDLTQPAPALQAVPLPGLDSTYRLLDVRVAATGQALIVAQHTVLGGDTRLYSYGLAAGTGHVRSDAPAFAAYTPGLLERSADGRTIVVNGEAGVFLRYDAATDAFGSPHTALVLDARPSVDAAAAHVAVMGDLYDGSLQFLRTVRAAQPNGGFGALSPDGQTHYLAMGPSYQAGGIVRSRVSDGSIVDHLPLPRLITRLRVSPDGTTLAVVCYEPGASSIAVVDLSQLR